MRAYPQPLSDEFLYASPEGQWPLFCRWLVLDQERPFSQQTPCKWEANDEPRDYN